jgi:hypothetical protein
VRHSPVLGFDRDQPVDCFTHHVEHNNPLVSP